MISYMQTESCCLAISEPGAIYEQALASIVCLTSGLDIFCSTYPENDRHERVLKGLHGFHIYANEYWVENLLAIGNSRQSFDHSTALYSCMRQLSNELEKFVGLPLHDQDRSNILPPNNQLQCLANFAGLYENAKTALQAKSAKKLVETLQDEGEQ